MALFFILLLVSLVAAIGIACAVNYFLQTGHWRSLGYAFFAVAVFLVFCATGLWDGASRHDWGPLTAVFMLLLAGGWCSIRFGKSAYGYWKKRTDRKNDR